MGDSELRIVWLGTVQFESCDSKVVAKELETLMGWDLYWILNGFCDSTYCDSTNLCALGCGNSGDSWSAILGIVRFVRSEKLQNESSPNFSNFGPGFCPEFCSEYSPKFSRIFRASFRGKRRPGKVHHRQSNDARFAILCQGAVKGIYLKGLHAQSRLLYREIIMACPVQWSPATPSALECQFSANQGSVVANPICKCRCHKAGHLQVRVAVGRRSTCVLKEDSLNKGCLGLPHPNRNDGRRV